jgi:ribonuclease D
MKKDRPRGWILSDESLRDIADSLPGTREGMERVRGLSSNFLHKRTDEMLELVKQGRANGPKEGPAVASVRPDPKEQSLVTRLLTLIREEAARSQIAPELLATRRDVEQLVYSGRTDHLLRGWRSEVIGERLVRVATEALGTLPQRD